MSSDVDRSAETPGDDDIDATPRPKRPPMSPAAREHLERTIARRLQDPEFHRKIEAVRRQLSEQASPEK